MIAGGVTSIIMGNSRIVFLMYHELDLATGERCMSESAYTRYILPVATFRRQMEWIKQSGIRGLCVSEALTYPAGANVCITFDDGCETDWIGAAPVLRELGLAATFYITAGRIGTAGYLSETQLRELDGQGFEIGCHSMTHPYLSDLEEPDLKREIVEAKDRIEQVLGHQVEHFSCPGGRYNERVLRVASRAKFKTVANSEFYSNTPSTNPYKLGRVAMMRDLPLAEFGDICHGRGLWKKRIAHRARRGVQVLLGNKNYDRLRGALLGEGQ
jgi:peptidoglycan/xylan/chitin deacetylase (PgdA/CDA1 family)